jgi:uncharacterized membrane protein
VSRRAESATDLAAMVAADPELQAQVRNDPAGALSQLAAPYESDVWIYRIIVLALALTMLLVVLASFVLVLFVKSIPDVLVAIGTAALGAVAGLLAPSTTRG